MDLVSEKKIKDEQQPGVKADAGGC